MAPLYATDCIATDQCKICWLHLNRDFDDSTLSPRLSFPQ